MTSDYDPSLSDFCDILKDYSLSGLDYFSKIGGKPKADIERTFGSLIENESQALEYKFSEAKRQRQSSFNFIPMPKPSGNDFLISFFVPRFRFLNKAKFHCAFCLIVWINQEGGKTIAFRFEPGDYGNSPHAYSHLQLSRVVRLPDHTTNIEKWMPVSYPAFPFRLDTPLQFFAATAVAVHGYSPQQDARFVAKAMRTAMQNGTAADRGRRVVAEIERVFGA
jgi:hypothetical protein